MRGYPVGPDSGHPGISRSSRALIGSAWPLTSRRSCSYVLIGALAWWGGLCALRAEAVLLTTLVFLGFNVAWLLLLAERAEPAESVPSAKTE